MAAITAGLVKELRDKTGAGMMDCKKALSETDGDVEAATDWLRKKGLAAAAKKAGRAAAEGLVGVVVDGPTGAMVEVNSETDFVARNEQFQELVSKVAAAAKGFSGDVEALKAATLADGTTVETAVANAIGVIGENMQLRRSAGLTVQHGVVGGYVHAQVAPGLGKIGVLVGLESEGDAAVLADTAKQLAMHIAAANPQAVTVDELDPAAVERERAIFADQAAASGKPENIIEKMVEGRLRKFYEEAVLMEQAFVINPDERVKAVVEAAGKAAGAPVRITAFEKFVLGEGVEKEVTDLAAEVSQLAGA